MNRRSIGRLVTPVLAAMMATALVACAGDDPSDTHGVGPDSPHASDTHHLPSGSAARVPDRPIVGPQGAVGQFVVECGAAHRNHDDPIVHAGHHGASHLHQYFGSRATRGDSTYGELTRSSTTCDHPADTAAYWIPALLVDGEPVDPLRAVAYYRAGPGVDPATVTAYPPSLMLIAGDPTTTGPQPTSVVSWSCGGGRRDQVPPDCPWGTTLRLLLTFPDCWDGERHDSPDHRSHAAYSSGGTCDAAHPVPIPQLQLAVDFPPIDPRRATLASGPTHTAHGDFWNTWDQAALEREVDHCLRRDLVCGVAG